MKFLEVNQIVPGANAQILEILPFNGTIALLIGNHKVVLGLEVARNVFAEPL